MRSLGEKEKNSAGLGKEEISTGQGKKQILNVTKRRDLSDHGKEIFPQIIEEKRS